MGARRCRALAAVVIWAGACSGPGGTGRGRASTNTVTDATTHAASSGAPISLPTTTGRPVGPAPTWPASTGAPGPTVWSAGPWVAAGRPVNGTPAVFTTSVQSSAGTAVGAARLDTSRLRVALYAGIDEPPGPWSAQGAVAPALWPSLVATFNSGFQLRSSRGGFYADGRVGAPLRDGAGSLVIFQDGSATVGQWGRDQQLTATVVAVRQNLELLVDGGRRAANVGTNIEPTWGFTLNGVIANWRSAVGVDAAGRLLYVGGPGLYPSGLADALIAVGAQRAMELDINPAWVSFNTFTDGPAGLVGAKLLAGMSNSATRYLSPSRRDFIAVFAR